MRVSELIRIGSAVGLAFASIQTFAGVGSSGGGFAVVCRDQNRVIRSAELLDLYEARVVFKRKLFTPDGTNTQADYIDAIQNSYTLQGSPEYFDIEVVIEQFKKFYYSLNYVTNASGLPPANDLGKTIAPPAGCAIEQVALFGGNSQDPAVEWGFVNREIWDAFDSQSQAALLVHELRYGQGRSIGEQTSENARIFVGLAFSTRGTPVNAGVPENRQECITTLGVDQLGTSAFYVFPQKDANGNDGVTFQFQHLFGQPFLTKTTAIFKGIPRLELAEVQPDEDGTHPPVVSTPNANSRVIVNIDGDQGAGQQLELRYIFGKPAQLTLVRNGKRIVAAPIYCGLIQ